MAHVTDISRLAQREAPSLLSQFAGIMAPGGSEPGPAEALGLRPTLFPNEESNGEREPQQARTLSRQNPYQNQQQRNLTPIRDPFSM